MFDHMKEINKIVNQKIHEIETVVTKSENNFVEEINLLIQAKDDLQKLNQSAKKNMWWKNAQLKTYMKFLSFYISC